MGGWRTVLRSTTRSLALKLCSESCREQGGGSRHASGQRQQLQGMQRSARGDRWAGRQRRQRRARRRAAAARKCGAYRCAVAQFLVAGLRGKAPGSRLAGGQPGVVGSGGAVANQRPPQGQGAEQAASLHGSCLLHGSGELFSGDRRCRGRKSAPATWLAGGRCDTAMREAGECQHPAECPVV